MCEICLESLQNHAEYNEKKSLHYYCWAWAIQYSSQWKNGGTVYLCRGSSLIIFKDRRLFYTRHSQLFATDLLIYSITVTNHWCTQLRTAHTTADTARASLTEQSSMNVGRARTCTKSQRKSGRSYIFVSTGKKKWFKYLKHVSDSTATTRSNSLSMLAICDFVN